MPALFIQKESELPPLEAALARATEFAIDCEAAGFHRYSDRLCLIQITVGVETYLLDPLAFDPSSVLGPPLADPEIRTLLHGGDYDLRLLDRDLDLQIKGVFDTQVAATLVGEPGVGLSALVQKYFGITLSKKFQRADWARRPLTDDMLEYAASDTRYLAALAELLKKRLIEMDRLTWAEEEFALMETIRWTEPERGDPVLRVKGARDMDARTVHGLRSGLEWRDGLAREGDRAPFRVVADPVLMALAASPPSTVDALVHTKGFSRSITRSASRTLLEELTRVAALPETELAGYPARETGGRGRPPPEIEELVLALKEVRNAGADRIELPRGTVLPNAALLEIAWARPSSLAELVEVPGVKRWQAGVVGEALIGVLPSD